MNTDRVTAYREIAADLIRTEYGLGPMRGFIPISNGFANLNARVETDAGRFLFRVVLQKSEPELQEEMVLMKYLKQHQFPAAYPIQRSDGRFINKVKEYILVVLFEFLEGEEPRPSLQTASEIGSAAASLHQLPFNHWKERQNDLSIDKCIEMAESGFPDSHGKLHELLNHFSEETGHLSELITPDLPEGLVHGDLYPDNTIFRGDTLVGVLDFEEFCVDTLLFDVGNAIQGFCYRGTDLYPGWMHALLTSYHKKRPFIKYELELLPWYVRWAALAQISWHLRNSLLKRFDQNQFNRVQLLMKRILKTRELTSELKHTIRSLTN